MVISIASQKGGTGKTTTTLALAAGLARRGKRILLIDIDSQANSSKVLLPQYQELRKEQTLYQTILESKPLRVHPSPIENLAVVPSHILLSDTDMALTSALDHREARLKRQLDDIKEHYDFVFIDCPPALSWLTINAFTASDGIIVAIANRPHGVGPAQHFREVGHHFDGCAGDWRFLRRSGQRCECENGGGREVSETHAQS